MELSQLIRLEQFYQMKEFIKKTSCGGVKKGALTEEEAEKKFQDGSLKRKPKLMPKNPIFKRKRRSRS